MDKNLKLSEVKDLLCGDKVTDELVELFYLKLRRVRGNFLKCQHCYTLAYDMKDEFASYAVDIINYSIDNFAESWSDYKRAYHILGMIYERTKDYENAKIAYLKSQDAVINSPLKDETKNGYIYDLSLYLMKNEIYLNNFNFSDDLVLYYNNFLQSGDFSLSISKNRLICLVAQIIISIHNDDRMSAKSALNSAYQMLDIDYKGELFSKLKRHHYNDSACATDKIINYLNTVKKEMR